MVGASTGRGLARYVRKSLALGQKKNQRTYVRTESLVDRGGWIWDFQHCIVITRGQEERIPKRQALWELTLALGRFPFDFVFFLGFSCFFYIFFVIFSDFD